MTDDYILIRQLVDSLEMALRHAPKDVHTQVAGIVLTRAYERLSTMREVFREAKTDAPQDCAPAMPGEGSLPPSRSC
jgi:hypothetical protein